MRPDNFQKAFAVAQDIFNWLLFYPQLEVRKSPTVAGILSILPGVGHIYIGQRLKGSILLVTICPLFVLTIPLSIIDTIVLAQQLKRGKAITRWECFWNREAAISKDVWSISNITKFGRTSKFIGTEERIIDNSKSGSKLLRNLKISHEWSYSYTVEHEKANTTINTTTIQVRDGITKYRSVEDLLRDKFAYSYGTKHIYEEEVQIEVPPLTRVRVLLGWKNILEVGTMVLHNQQGKRIKLPFSIVIGVTFDQTQLDG